MRTRAGLCSPHDSLLLLVAERAARDRNLVEMLTLDFAAVQKFRDLLESNLISKRFEDEQFLA